MAKKIFWLGMLAMVPVFGMIVVGCSDETTPHREITISGTPRVGHAITAVMSDDGFYGDFSWNFFIPYVESKQFNSSNSVLVIPPTLDGVSTIGWHISVARRHISLDSNTFLSSSSVGPIQP